MTTRGAGSPCRKPVTTVRLGSGFETGSSFRLATLTAGSPTAWTRPASTHACGWKSAAHALNPLPSEPGSLPPCDCIFPPASSMATIRSPKDSGGDAMQLEHQGKPRAVVPRWLKAQTWNLFWCIAGVALGFLASTFLGDQILAVFIKPSAKIEVVTQPPLGREVALDIHTGTALPDITFTSSFSQASAFGHRLRSNPARRTNIW
jgi:hypothetical protein